MQFPFLPLATAGLATAILVGCVSLARPIVPCPLTYSEQEKELLAIVPKGIRTEEALRRLAAVGVEGSFGISRRVYYCDLWNRTNGDRWHINVALLFDDTGKLYKTQVAECDVAVVPEEGAHASGAQSGASPSRSSSASADSGSSNRLN